MPLPRVLSAKRTQLSLAPSSETRRAARPRAIAFEFPNPPESPATFYYNEVFRKHAQMQVYSLWCWNAVGSAVACYYTEILGGGAIQPEDFQLQCANLQFCKPVPKPACCDLPLGDGGEPIGSFIPYMEGMDEAFKQSLGKRGPGFADCPGQPEWIAVATGLVTAERERYTEADRPNEDDIHRVIEAISKGHVVVMHVGRQGKTDHVITIYGTKFSDGQRYLLVADPLRGFATWDALPDQWTWEQSIFFKRVRQA